MMESLRKPAFSRLWKVALFMLLFVAGIAIAFDFYYDLNDDTTIKDIISGAYTGSPSGYSVQMLYPLSFVVSLLYKAIPGIPWYGLFLCICQFGAVALIAWRSTKLVKKQWMQIGVLVFEVLFAAGFLIRQFVMIQYSVTSGICMATAIFLFLTGEEKESPGQYLKQNLVPVLLVVLSFMIRTEMCLILFPFLLLAGFSKWMAQEKVFTVHNVKKYLYVLGAAFLGMMIVFSLDKLSTVTAGNHDDWKSFQSFFDARTKLYDFYGIPSYEENQEFYQEIGLAREEYTLLENYNFSLDEAIDEHLLEKLVDYQEAHAGEGQSLSKTAGFVSKKNLKEALWLYKEQVLGMKSGVYAYLLLALYFSYVLVSSGRKKSGFYWKILLLLVIRSILWLYLFMVDRSLERITCPLLLAESMVLLGWIIGETTRKQESTEKFLMTKAQGAGVYILLAVCAAAALVSNVQRTGTEYENRERINSRWESLIAYCKEHTEAYYVIDVYSSTSYEGVFYSEKIFEDVDNSYRNFDICGGWLSKSPLMKEKLVRSNISDLESALYAGERVYFVADGDKDLSWLIDYYAFKGQNIEPERVDTIYDGEIPCFAVYRLNF